MASDETETILGFLEGTLGRDERERLLDRMQADPALRRELETLQAVRKAVAEAPEDRPRADFAKQFMAQQAGGGLFEQLKAWLDALPVPAPALALAGGVALCGLFFVGGGGGPAQPQHALAGCKLVASAGDATLNGQALPGAEASLRLEDKVEVSDDFEGALLYDDGTRIKIRPSSSLVVQARGLYLHAGGVWLNVTKDKKGFRVETPVALAAVKGTRFLVELYEGATRMKVTVWEGLVEVASALESKLLGAGKGTDVGPDGKLAHFLVDRESHQMFQDAAEGDFSLER